MKTIHAIYENGVFRPTTPVSLPEGSEVAFEPRSTEPTPSLPADSDSEPMNAIYEILSRSYETGETDLAARHNEHQP